jgi:hypothetical protein
MMPSLPARAQYSHDPANTVATCFRYEGHEVAVRCTRASDLRWLAGFFACGFAEVPIDGPDHTVELVVDTSRFDRLSDAGRDEGHQTVVGFAQDASSVRFERWASISGHLWFRDLTKPHFFGISDNATQVEILAREWTGDCRIALMRVVRELSMNHVVATGGTILHSSAVQVHRGVIAMCGPKRSGKTTLLLSLLRTGRASYLSNDRCVLRAGNDQPMIRGLPTLVSIRKGCLDHFPSMRRRLRDVRPELATWAADPNVPTLAGAQKRTKFVLSPPELAQLLGGYPQVENGPLQALLFPRVTDSPSRLTVIRLDAAEALERFRKGLFRASQPSLLGDVFVSVSEGGTGISALESAADIESQVVQQVPCFECQLGGGSAPTIEDCRPLLDQPILGLTGW